MTWQSALRAATQKLRPEWVGPIFKMKEIDWERLVCIDFETYYDVDYTLKKLSTSRYVRDERFKAQMMAIKVGSKPTKIVPHAKIGAELRKINWSTHSLLCHNTHFDGLILSHHYGIVPSYYFDTLCMARGLHSNEIGAGLDEVSIHYGGAGKIKDVLETTLGVRDWSPTLFAAISPYCANDNDEMFRVFQAMHPKMPDKEMDLIDLTIRQFCDPILELDLPRIQAEYQRELDERERLLTSLIDLEPYKEDVEVYKKILPKKAERALPPKEHDELMTRRIIGSNDRFAALLRAEGIEPPVKISPAWMKGPKDAGDEGKYAYAFAKDDEEFIGLPDSLQLSKQYDLNDPTHITEYVAVQKRLQDLIDARLAVKSLTNMSKAEHMLAAGQNGMKLPVAYNYYRAHTGRHGGGNKMNLQNLERKGELRLSIRAPKGFVLPVVDSGQIEARVNAWLWGQQELLDGWRAAKKDDVTDAYTRFASMAFGRPVTKADQTERHVGKVCVLGLGYQMGAPKLQTTLAKGALGGPKLVFPLDECQRMVSTYRRMNYKIQAGWNKCSEIIEDMAAGRNGEHGCLYWGDGAIYLPNGMTLKYPELRKTKGDKGWDEWTYKVKNGRAKIYGGLLCENIVQALARIIVMYQMLEINKTMRAVMTTHDEVVTCVRKSAAELSLRRMLKIMTTSPDWAPDLPLAAEGGYAENYSK